MKTRTKYEVVAAHSGTSEGEIAKAKREYRKQVKIGKTHFFDIVRLVFTDINCKIKCRFHHPVHGDIGDCTVKN